MEYVNVNIDKNYKLGMSMEYSILISNDNNSSRFILLNAKQK